MKPVEFVDELSRLFIYFVSVSSVLHLFIACFSVFFLQISCLKIKTPNFEHDSHLKLAVVAQYYKSVYKISANKSDLLTYWGHKSVKHNHILANVSVIEKCYLLHAQLIQ